MINKKKRKRRKKQLTKSSKEMEFVFVDGGKARDVYELRDWMLLAKDKSYFYHTDRNGNDFSRWLRIVLNERGLATRVEMIKTKNGTARLLGRFLRARKNNKNKY